MINDPMSAVGQLETEVRNVERKVDGKAEAYEVHTLRSNVDRLDYSNRELIALVDGLRYELETLKEEIRLIKDPK